MKRVFDHPISGRNAAQRLKALWQSSRSVTDCAIYFRMLPAESGWNTEALHSAFLNGLSEVLKDALDFQDNPDTLDELIVLAIRIDNRRQEHRHERTDGLRIVSSVLGPTESHIVICSTALCCVCLSSEFSIRLLFSFISFRGADAIGMHQTFSSGEKAQH